MHISPTSVSSIFAKNILSARLGLKTLAGLALAVTFATSSVAQTPTPCPANFPAAGVVHAVGNYFPLNGRFYVMGGRSADTVGSDFPNPFEYNPNTNTWVTKVATYPDSQVNDMACGVLTVGGTPLIYCVGGSAAGGATSTARVFSYNPVTDVITTLTAADNWPGNAAGTILPGGFAVAGNKLYIIGGFNIGTGSTRQTWHFDPTAAVGSRWLQNSDYPLPRSYIPAAAIGGLIHTGGGSNIVGTTITDTADSFRYDPVIDIWIAIANIPRATGETRAVVINNQMLVLGGGRTAPNPSTEVDVYNHNSNTWTIGLPLMTARRDFPADSDGSSRIWLVGGYDTGGLLLNTMEIYGPGVCSTPTPTPSGTPSATATPTPSVTPSPTPTPTASEPPGSPTPPPSPTPTATIPPPTATPIPTPCGVTFSENFDGVIAPALPGEWATAVTGDAQPWRTSTIFPTSGLNDAFAGEAFSTANTELITPVIAAPAAGVILSFQNLFNMTGEAPPGTVGYDGMVLEISINGGPYADIISAGSGFVTGGYTHTIIMGFGSPIAGRMAWSGVSAGSAAAPAYITTTVSLPAAANGQNIQLKWRVATDNIPDFGVNPTGVRIDSIILTPANCTTPTPTPTPTTPPAAQALNLSTRLLVQTGANVAIGGFIITGSAPKQVLLRGIGPSLTGFGVPDALADPVMELHGTPGFATITNDNWRDTQQTEIQATGIPPTNDLESAIVATLSPGAYTAILKRKNNISGVALVEVYDLAQAVAAKLGNISTRAFVSTGSNILIAGFILGGHSGSDNVILRGIGPSLTPFGVIDALANPTLELRDQSGAVIRANNDWQDDPAQAAIISAVGLAPTNPLESGIAATLSPGQYTVLLAGLNNGTGSGLVEVYDLGGTPAPPP